jgi:hypothetical protein
MNTQLNNANNFPVFGFNTATPFDGEGSIKLNSKGELFTEENDLEYGFLNKKIQIKISKLFYIQKIYIGLGDMIDFFTKKLYIKNLIVYLTNGNCGCEERRIKFNKWVKIPFIKFGLRELYAADLVRLEHMEDIKEKNKKPTEDKQINEIKIIVQDDKKFESIHKQNPSNYTKNKEINVSQPKNTNKPTPVSPPRIHGGCGCRNKK